MKKILIIADGKTAQRFLQRLISSDATSNKYYLVYYNDETLPETKIEKFVYHKFDPTSFSKLSHLMSSEDFYQCMLLTDSKEDLKQSYENIRKIDENIQITLLDRWDLEFDDKNITLIDTHDTLSNIFSNYLPDLPLFVQNLGLGTGEIAQFGIPFGSPFIYRHLRNIDQKRWKIAAVFREHKLLLPSPSMMLLPNDSILAVGNPNVLKGVYKSINRAYGQFPIPFGENIYCYIDMLLMCDEDIEVVTNDAMILHSKLNSNKLIFKIVNSRFSTTLDKLKKYANTNMVVEFEYHHNSAEDIILEDIDRHYVGLIVANQKFMDENLELLYRSKLPIFKVANSGFFSIKESVLLSSNSKVAEKISSIVFDISSQLDIEITLFDVHLENSEEQQKIISHFQNLAKLFEEKVKVVQIEKNPILALEERDDFLQFVIFDKKILSSKIASFFSTDIEKHYFRFSNNYQLFIPSE
jgi:hypothetical protein